MDKSAQEAIQKATIAAQKDYLKIDKSSIRTLEDAYIIAASNIERAIKLIVNGDSHIRLGHLGAIKDQITNTLQKLAYLRKAIFESNFNTAIELSLVPVRSAIGFGRVANPTLLEEQLREIVIETLAFTQSFIGHGGLQLSDRLWRVDNGAKVALTTAIEQAIISGDSAGKAAWDFVVRGEVMPPALLRKMNGADVNQLSVFAKKEVRIKAYQQARRVLRTELNRAYTHAYEASVKGLPGAIGTRFMLSANHKVRDICDVHAVANKFNLGPGVYPFGQNPCPAHPNTTSYIVVVFADD